MGPRKKQSIIMPELPKLAVQGGSALLLVSPALFLDADGLQGDPRLRLPVQAGQHTEHRVRDP